MLTRGLNFILKALFAVVVKAPVAAWRFVMCPAEPEKAKEMASSRDDRGPPFGGY